MSTFTKFLMLPLMLMVFLGVSMGPSAFALGRKGNIYVNGEKVGYVVDEAAATFEVSMPEKVELELRSADDERNVTRLYGSYSEAAQHANAVLPSFEQIGFIGKVADDRIYATIEAELEDDKVELITALVGKLDGDAQSFICTALVLSHHKDACPAALRAAAAGAAEQFVKGDPFASRPIGFYTWNDLLRMIFTRDRWLQRPFDTRDKKSLAVAGVISNAIKGDPALRKLYSDILYIYSKLTNPTTNYFSALDAITDAKPFAFFPPSRSREADLIKKLVGQGKDLTGKTMDVVIDAIKRGEINLMPASLTGKGDSGWYDYQQYALEPFLLTDRMPEARKLSFNGVYKKRLENAFRSAATQARETHVKQLETVPMAMAEPDEIEIELLIEPEFDIEPMPTYYQRVAQGYVFLIKALDVPILNGAVLQLESEDDGADKVGLSAETYYRSQLNKPPETVRIRLRELIPLFNQFSSKASDEIGMYSAEEGPTGRVDDFTSGWKNWTEMKKDIRVVVPIGPIDPTDPSKGIDCWVVMGIEPLNIEVRYGKKPTVNILRKNVKAKIEYGTNHYTILVPVFAEVVIPGSAPMTREEFRKICDKYKTKEAILAALRKGAY